MTAHPYSCQDVDSRLEAAHDGELPAAEAELVAAHLRACPRCVAREHELRSVSHALRVMLPHYQAPAELLARVRADIGAAAQNSPAARHSARPFRRLAALGGGAFAYAASLLAVASLGWIASGEFHSRANSLAAPGVSRAASDGVSDGLDSRSPSGRVRDDVLTAHVRSLLPGHLLDIASTDRHTVKPWFSGKLAYSPRVENLDSAGFPLFGGRLDYVGGRQVVALVYGRRKHFINLFLWPSARDADSRRAESALAINGYAVRSWAQDGMTYWAVSDVARADLDTLERLYRSTAPARQR